VLFAAFSACVALTTFALLRLRVWELEKAQTSTDKDLKDSEARFEHIFNNSPIPLFVTSLSTGKVQAANKSAIRQFGIGDVDPAGLSAPDFYVNPAERSEFAERISKEGHASHLVQLRTLAGVSFWAAVSSQKMTHDNSPVILTAIQDGSLETACFSIPTALRKEKTPEVKCMSCPGSAICSHARMNNLPGTCFAASFRMLMPSRRAKNRRTTRRYYWFLSERPFSAASEWPRSGP
jgi:PAS domain S-box-containing protein